MVLNGLLMAEHKVALLNLVGLDGNIAVRERIAGMYEEKILNIVSRRWLRLGSLGC